MIIFGTRGITTTPEKGAFNCPTCNSKQDFRHRRVRRFFHLYFIPLIPLNQLGEYVECRTCKDTFDLGILDYDPEAIEQQLEAEYQIAIKSVMIHILLADCVIDDAEVDEVSKIYQELTGIHLGVRAVHEEIANVKRGGGSLPNYLKHVQGRLNDEGKEAVIKAALMVALADGEFQQEEKDLLAQIGADLGMTKAHVNGVIADVT